MIRRIQICPKVYDTRAVVRKKYLEKCGFKGKIKDVRLVDVYTIEKNLTYSQLTSVGEILTNPVTQESYSKTFHPSGFNWCIEIGYQPGVTDNIAHTAREMIEDRLKIKFTQTEGVFSSQMIFLTGNINRSDAFAIGKSLANPLIERIHTKSFKEFEKDNGMDAIVPRVKLGKIPQISTVNLAVSDIVLGKIGKLGIENRDKTRRGPLALDLLSMKAIQNYFQKSGRNPTDIELESLAQTWSEHCKHTIFADPIDDIYEGLFKKYIKGATEKIRKLKKKKDFCVSVFTDNSGAIVFDDDYLITHKVETHNSPSALDPFGGAVTGIVGVNRDTIGFGLGAKPVANFYGFCLADPRKEVALYRDPKRSHKMLSPRRIMDGVIEGVNSGGNCSGIPTPQGFMYFDDRFRAKPLVFVGTVGIIPRLIHGKSSHVKKARRGDLIVMIGGRVGKDGIHGATFSSEALDQGSPATAVQIGDPITQKKLSDAIVREARGMLLYDSITDNGAGGLSCSVSEMAKESGGCFVELEKAPLKYPGLAPWEIWISESQERMTLAVAPQKWKKFKELMGRRGVEVTEIGKFTNSGRCKVSFHSKTVADLDMQFLHNGRPKRMQKTTLPRLLHQEHITPKKDLTSSLVRMIGRLNIASIEFISQQYDHVVLGNSVLSPLQGKGRVNGDASVIRPLLTSFKGLVMSQGLYPRYSDIDTYTMAAASIDTAVRNCVATGANPGSIALLDNFCWCSSNDPFRLGQLKRAAKACFDYATAYQTPFISGKDSMFNDFKGYDKYGREVFISIPPTVLITSIGIVDSVYDVVSLDVKIAGDLVYILGDTHDELGGSEYFSLIGDLQKKTYIGNIVPKVNALNNKKLYDAYFRCIKKGLIASSQSVGRGGLGAALAKKAIAGLLGLEINLALMPGKISRDDYALYSESQGRIVVTIAPKNEKEFEKSLKGVSFACIGKVIKNPKVLINGLKGNRIVKIALDTLVKSYRETFKGF